MFTLKVHNSGDDASVSLYFDNDMISLTFDPENPAGIKDVKWEDGNLDISPRGGEFYLRWAGDFIEMGCGNGSNLTARVKKTPKLTASLKKAFNQWKALF